MAVVQKIAAIRDRQPLLRVLLHQENADAGFLDPRQRAEQLAAHQRRQAQATARPASGSTAPTSWRGRPPPSAARRRSWSAPVACAVRRACGNSDSTRSMFAASLARARLGCAPSIRFSCTVRSANTPRSSGTSAMPGLDDLMRRPVGDVDAVHRHRARPAVARVWPAIARRNVLLPAPLAPSITTISPIDIVGRHILHRAVAAVEHREVLHLKHRRLRDRPGSPRHRPAPPAAFLRRSSRRCSSPRSGRTGCGSRP